ncbi:hypothetical protein GFM02_03970 [Rhizobium leguminosarum bv. viciae]|uniref:hypothetical protein n=1 Tax=Rhizobium leguminosarum TaxID=384 RepID=UPI00144204D1|nr:hypothetical protein [Rhizobium leguminosarum]NKK97443.1 hypothetical protein [Rhizobium leguminosarum bv. viciae]
MGRSGYFYVYGNLGWDQRKPRPTHDLHTGGQLFKFAATHVADGPHYVFNNSWMLRAPVPAWQSISIASCCRQQALSSAHCRIGHSAPADIDPAGAGSDICWPRSAIDIG